MSEEPGKEKEDCKRYDPGPNKEGQSSRMTKLSSDSRKSGGWKKEKRLTALKRITN